MDRYFEGDTTCREEALLRSFFAKAELPDDLKDYRPLFGCIDEERVAISPRKTSKVIRLSVIYYVVSGVAASLLILLGIFTFNRQGEDTNSAFINGTKYTDIQIVHQQAQAALAEVSFSKEDIADEMVPDDF